MQCSTSPVCCLELVPLSVLKAEHASHQLAVLLWHLLLTFGGLRNSASWSLPVSTRATYKSALCTFRQPSQFSSDKSNLSRIWAHLFLLKYRFFTETPS